MSQGDQGANVAAFESKVCEDMALPAQIIPRYRTTYFNHIFNSGYSAGYYGYLWSEVLDKDAFEYFEQQGIFNPDVALKFRRTFLEKGGSEEPMTLYREFRGADPDPGALLRARGLE
jgi:peptidyl-dipeptidase Dcp